MEKENRGTCRSVRFARKTGFLSLVVVIMLLATGVGLYAQEMGSIVGTVTDPSGAAIPAATVTITNQQTGVVVRSLTTNAQGNYAAAALPASTYSIRARKKGFTSAVHSSLVLNVGSNVRVNFRLKIGAVTQEVTVTAPVVHLQTENATVSQAVTGKHVAEIDINGRNFVQLATLVPGAAGPSLVGSFNTPVGVTADTGINFDGERQSHNVWSIDGMENYDRGCGGCIEVVPDQDAIQEFRVVSSNAGQTVGFGSGGHIQVEIKSGTRQYHGEVFEFNRNTALDTGDFFTNSANLPKPKLNFNDFGFNLGGPIYLPGHAKKTFFFFEGDWRRLVQGSTINVNGVPVGWTNGNFSSGNSPVILNHNDVVKTLPDGTPVYAPFSGNQIPSGMINSNAQILAKPNFIFMSPTTSSGRYIASSSVPTYVNEQILRVDHQFSDKMSLMFHYIRDGINQQFPTTLWSGDSYPSVGTSFLNQPQSFVLKLTNSISPTLLNEFMIGFNRQPLEISPTGTYTRPSGLNISQLFPENPLNRIPTISFGSPLSVNYDIASWPWSNVLNTWQIRDAMTKVSGNHTFSFGISWMHYLKEQELFGNTQGNFNFNGNATAGSYMGPNGQILTTPGNSFADFMMGNAYTYTELKTQTMPAYLNTFYGLWFGDTWKVRNGLNLNYGLRWEGMPHAYERHNQVAAFRPSLYDPAQAPTIDSSGHIVPNTGNLLNGMAIAGKNGIPRGLVHNHWYNFEPRFGFAWQPSFLGKMVIRGGAGYFFENVQGNDIYNVAPNPPFSETPQIFNTSLTNPGGGAATISPSNIQAYSPQYKQPYSIQWSFGVQRMLSNKGMFSVMYVGSKGTHQQMNRNINQPLAPAGNANINTIRPYPGWGNIGWYENSSNTNYNSLQVSMRFNSWHGLTSGVAYTYSHCLDYADNDVPGFINNAYNLAAEYGNCGYDVRHNLTANYVYSLPFFNHAQGVERHVLGGWQLSGITTFYSGSPFTVGFSGDPAQCGCGGYRANVIGNPNSGSGIHTAADWFNTAAFAPIPTGQFGNGARNIVYGDGINNFDVSVFKNFTGIPLPARKEGGTLQIRVEFYNFFNHTQFNGYNTTYGSGGFGAPSSARLPREIQLGGKFIF